MVARDGLTCLEDNLDSFLFSTFCVLAWFLGLLFLLRFHARSVLLKPRFCPPRAASPLVTVPAGPPPSPVLLLSPSSSCKVRFCPFSLRTGVLHLPFPIRPSLPCSFLMFCLVPFHLLSFFSPFHLLCFFVADSPRQVKKLICMRQDHNEHLLCGLSEVAFFPSWDQSPPVRIRFSPATPPLPMNVSERSDLPAPQGLEPPPSAPSLLPTVQAPFCLITPSFFLYKSPPLPLTLCCIFASLERISIDPFSEDARQTPSLFTAFGLSPFPWSRLSGSHLHAHPSVAGSRDREKDYVNASSRGT